MSGSRKAALKNLQKARAKRAEGVRNYKQMSGQYRQEVLKLALEKPELLKAIRDEDPKFFFGVIVKSVVDKIVDLNVDMTNFKPFPLEQFKIKPLATKPGPKPLESHQQDKIVIDVKAEETVT